jgi:hemoglobin-like flavoprotein
MPTRAINSNLLGATLKYLEPKKSEFISVFYSRLFSSSPAIFHFIIIEKETDMQHLQESYLQFLTQLVSLLQMKEYEKANVYVSNIGKQHFKMRVPIEYYEHFTRLFIETLRDFMGPAWTPQMAEQWEVSYKVIIHLIKKGYGL